MTEIEKFSNVSPVVLKVRHTREHKTVGIIVCLLFFFFIIIISHCTYGKVGYIILNSPDIYMCGSIIFK